MIPFASVNKFSTIFYSTTMAYIAAGVVGFFVLLYSVYNGYLYLFKPTRYQGIRFTTKNIAYITVLSAVSVTVTIIVSVTVPITVFPPIRIAFEGLMVKITGYIFGPIVGLLSGIVTDSLTLLFVPSYIHIAYTIVIASFGFLSGCVSFLNKSTGYNRWFLFWFTNLFIIAFGSVAIVATEFYSSASNTIPLFAGVNVTKTALVYFIAFGTFGSLILLWIAYFFYRFWDRSGLQWREIMPIITLCVINEYWVTTLISAWGDIAIISASRGGTENKGYAITMIGRLAMAPGKILFNVIVIYITYRAIRPLIKTNENAQG